MKKNIYILLVSVILISACAHKKVPMASGGSKSDGIVNMSFHHGLLEKPVIDWKAVKARATAICHRWGYGGSEAFGGAQKRCTNYYQGNCTAVDVTIPYQCIN